MVSASKHQIFTSTLLHWNSIENTRSMPWKWEKDPYKIWLSEIILQQTRVDQGLSYYNRFVEKYPNIGQLASAPEQEIFKLWEGLGYYSRCRNLIHTAKVIAGKPSRNFPDTYKGLLELKGIGPYTAAAIASFAFNRPHAVLDGNVSRLLARFFCIHTAIDSPDGKKEMELLANTLLEKNDPAAYNQAIMDFGALICKPRQPLCEQCLLRPYCCAFNKNLVQQLPYKASRIEKKHRWFYYFLLQKGEQIMLLQRSKKDIWQNLYEFPMVEEVKSAHLKRLMKSKQVKELLGYDVNVVHLSPDYKQQLTHQTIHGYFSKLEVKYFPNIPGAIIVEKSSLIKYAFPRMLRQYIQDFPL
ncbi:MAG: A/G-specific adenine glycosylase [Ferruginibacter sp.]